MVAQSTGLSQPVIKRKSSQPQWQRRLRYFYYRFVRMRGSSAAIARGLAAGVFAGCFPLFGLQTIMGVAIAAICKGNKLMAAAGTWISNPFTYVPIYFFNFRFGQWLLSLGQETPKVAELESLQALVTEPSLESIRASLATGTVFAANLFVGSFVVGLVCAICAYFAGLWGIRYMRHRRQQS
jgi:uncharacterized protein (DUF2062 family)